jgi:hypothetical protein
MGLLRRETEGAIKGNREVKGAERLSLLTVCNDEFERIFEESRVTMLPVPCLALLSPGL